MQCQLVTEQRQETLIVLVAFRLESRIRRLVSKVDGQCVQATYHGTTVTDDYRWLENWADPAVKTWSQAQNAHARAVLDDTDEVEALLARTGEDIKRTSRRTP